MEAYGNGRDCTGLVLPIHCEEEPTEVTELIITQEKDQITHRSNSFPPYPYPRAEERNARARRKLPK